MGRLRLLAKWEKTDRARSKTARPRGGRPDYRRPAGRHAGGHSAAARCARPPAARARTRTGDADRSSSHGTVADQHLPETPTATRRARMTATAPATSSALRLRPAASIHHVSSPSSAFDLAPPGYVRSLVGRTADDCRDRIPIRSSSYKYEFPRTTARYFRYTMLDTSCRSYAPRTKCGAYFVLSDIVVGALTTSGEGPPPVAPGGKLSPATVRLPRLDISSRRATSKRGRVRIRLICRSQRAACRGTVLLRASLRAGRRARAARVP